MNNIKYIALIILLFSNIYEVDDPFVYDICEYEVYSFKEEEDTEDIKDTRIFEAKSGDDCKDRPIREYIKDSYDYSTGKLKSKGTTNNFYAHCCYMTFDRIKDFELGKDENMRKNQ